MSQPSAGYLRLWLAVAGLVAVAFVSVGLAGVLYFALRTKSPMPQLVDVPVETHFEKMLGLEPIVGIEEDGFFGTETSTTWKGEPYRWTQGTAKLIVPLGERPPQALYVRLGLTVPRTVQLRVQVNGTPLYDEKVAMGAEWARTFDVSGMSLGKRMTIEIISDTIIPAEAHKGATDTRSLGVAMRGIMLMSGEQDFANVLLGAKSVPGVNEEGFWYQEHDRGQPCRWTNGAAKLTVPIRGKAPKTLSLICMVPNRPDFRVQVKVNGQSLFNDVVKGNGDWSIGLPLAGVAIEREACVELISSIVVPSESGSGSKDSRKLGLRVRRMMLVRDPGN